MLRAGRRPFDSAAPRSGQAEVGKTETLIGYGGTMRGEKIRVVLDVPLWIVKPAVWFLLFYRKIRYGYSFRKIPLTRGKYAIVDTDDYQRLSKHKWYACGDGPWTNYAARSVKKGRKWHSLQMHRDIIQVPRGMVIDHINHNGLDNRKANLRAATVAQNGWNSRNRKSRSKYRGVWWHKQLQKWRVGIWFNGNRKHIGYFEDVQEAAKAYDRAAHKYHGQFAVLNFKQRKGLLHLPVYSSDK